MTGRGIDQILPYPVSPVLHESYIQDAREYVHLAERAHGPIPRAVHSDYVWGDVLPELERAGIDLRIINLETTIISSERFWLDKEVLYRMDPRNIGCLTAARIDCCCLANNHLLDWGYQGLSETLETLDKAGTAHAGAGHTLAEAAAPAVLPLPSCASGKGVKGGWGRVLVFALGSTTSGIPPEWGAADERAGVNLCPDLSEQTALRVASDVQRLKQPRDVVIVSIHWGPNWGHEIPNEQIRFAHRLVDEGVDIVHGHSSHHVKAIEVYRDRLILYGCGDFLTDYEGIRGYERFRGDLALMYLIQVDRHNGRLLETRLVPMQARRFRMTHAARTDARWLRDLLNRIGAPLGTQVRLERDNSMTLLWSNETRHRRGKGKAEVPGV